MQGVVLAFVGHLSVTLLHLVILENVIVVFFYFFLIISIVKIGVWAEIGISTLKLKQARCALSTSTEYYVCILPCGFNTFTYI